MRKKQIEIIRNGAVNELTNTFNRYNNVWLLNVYERKH